MHKMLKKLRSQLTVVYFLTAVVTLLVVGGISYALLRYQLYQATDQALQVKMAMVYSQYGLPVPPELERVQQDWLGEKGYFIPQIPRLRGSSAESESEESEAHTASISEELFDEELAPVFVIPLNASSELVPTSNIPDAPISQDREAAQAALANGHDLRTTIMGDGSRVRLLTYKLSGTNGPSLLQVGRILRDQDKILNQYMIGLLILAGLSVAILGMGSWLISGKALRPAQQAWSQQQDFVSNASHELRTPLTLIRATADYAIRTNEETRNQKSTSAIVPLQEIVAECDYMNSLVDDLLLLSRLDTSRLKIAHEAVELTSLLSGVREQFLKLCEEKQVQVEIVSSDGWVMGDITRLRQILFILLDNGLRFTPPGGMIQIKTNLIGKRRQIIVTDNGSGIPTKELAHIFERFYQVKGSSVDETRNNGLGLAIAKGLVEAQRGSIAVESQLGKGTSVIISLLPAD